MDTCRRQDAALQTIKDDETIGILIAISVVSKQLAAKLTKLSQQEQLNMEGGRPYGKNERTCGCCFRTETMR